MAVRRVKSLKKKKYLVVSKAKLYLIANFNNTILSLCDEKGNLLKQMSCGACGFKNNKKSTPFASQTAISKIVNMASELFQVKFLDVIIRGPGLGRDMLSFLVHPTIVVTSISDQTSVPHNGTRPCRRRRV